jgi:hypothetical protein
MDVAVTAEASWFSSQTTTTWLIDTGAGDGVGFAATVDGRGALTAAVMAGIARAVASAAAARRVGNRFMATSGRSLAKPHA